MSEDKSDYIIIEVAESDWWDSEKMAIRKDQITKFHYDRFNRETLKIFLVDGTEYETTESFQHLCELLGAFNPPEYSI